MCRGVRRLSLPERWSGKRLHIVALVCPNMIIELLYRVNFDVQMPVLASGFGNVLVTSALRLKFLFVE